MLQIDNKPYSSIGKGFLVLFGVTLDDTKEDAAVMAEKISKLRVFDDENGKMNLSIQDVKGSLHIVSQFTLYADCHHGNRPSFTDAAKPEQAIPIYEFFIEECKKYNIPVETGVFGADMKIDLINDGPVTIFLEVKEGKVLYLNR
jgi:D-tyrosyl-tRNA(Tyr) deacylase